jgi:hypothetical protein
VPTDIAQQNKITRVTNVPSYRQWNHREGRLCPALFRKDVRKIKNLLTAINNSAHTLNTLISDNS